MASLRDMRARIQSVKNTQQITRAMKMVSAAKLRKSQEQIVNMRPYARRIMQIIKNIAATQSVENPLLAVPSERNKILFVVLTSDRGLCGGFNNAVCRFTEKFIKDNKNKYEKMDFIFIGRKGSDYFKRRGIVAKQTMLNLSKEISQKIASDVANECMSAFEEGEYNEVQFIYNEFKSAISQKLVAETILPINLANEEVTSAPDVMPQITSDFIFEPSPEAMIEGLLEQHFSMQVFRCMAESVAAEHAARMTSMENATKNAKEMINKMTLIYNNLRQASITKELIEICSGAEAVNG